MFHKGTYISVRYICFILIVLIIQAQETDVSSMTQGSAEGYYNSGIDRMETGKEALSKAEQLLYSLLTVSVLEGILKDDNSRKAILESGELPFETFERYAVTAERGREVINQLKTLSNSASKDFNQAIAFFDRAIEQKPGYADAYIRKAEAYLKLGRESEAVKSYEECRKAGFSNLTLPPDDELRDIVHSIARIYATDAGEGEASEYDYVRKIVEEFVNFKDKQLKEQYKKLTDQRKQTENEVDRIENRFELARFYKDTGRRILAQNEYLRRKQEFENILGAYKDDKIRKILDLQSEIENMTDAFFRVDVDPALLGDEESVIKKASIALIPSGRNVSAEDMRKLFKLCFPSGRQQDMKVIRLLTHVSINQSRAARIIPSGEYSFYATIPQLIIKWDNSIPFKAELYKGAYYMEKLMTEPSQKTQTRLQLEETPASGMQPIRINFSQDSVFSNPVQMEVDKKYREFSKGLYKASMEASFTIEPAIERGQSEVFLKLEKVLREIKEEPKMPSSVLENVLAVFLGIFGVIGIVSTL